MRKDAGKSFTVKKVLLYMFLVCAVSCTALVLFMRHTSHENMLREVNAIRDAGWPASEAEAEKWVEERRPPIPPELTAELERAGLLSKLVDYGDLRTIPLLNSRLDPQTLTRSNKEQISKLRVFVKAQSEYLNAIRDIASSNYDFPKDYQISGSSFAAMAVLAALDGDSESAVDLLAMMLKRARNREHDFGIGFWYTRHELAGRAAAALQYVVAFTELSDDQLVRLQTAAGLCQKVDPHKAQLAVSRAIGIDYFFQPIGGGTADSVFDFVYTSIGKREKDFRYFLEACQGMMDSCDLPFPQRYRAFRENHRLIDEADSHFQVITARLSIGPAPRLDFLMPVHLARAITGIERFRLRHNALPETIEEIAPEFIDAVPMDFASGKPVSYRQTDDGYIVYSFGDNLTDDGGKHPEDIILAVQR